MKKRRLLIGCLVPIAALTFLMTVRADIPEAEENPSVQPETELLLTNTTDLVGLYLEGYDYPLGSWVWSPTILYSGRFLFEPWTIVWADTSNLPSGLAGITNFVPTSLESVNAWPLWMTLWPQSNTVTVLQPWSDETLTEFSVPDGFPSWSVYEKSLYPACVLFGINYTNQETLAEEGYTQFSVPMVVTHAWLMDVGSRDTYWANLEADCEAAEAASMSGSSMSMDDEDPSGGGGDPCSITNLTQPFYVTSITLGTNGTTITWQSCPMFRYLVFSANLLGTNTAWAAQSYSSYIWGQGDATATSWTDISTTNANVVTQRFYRVQRLAGSPIAAGGDHSLAILTNGTLWAWGEDDSSQLGDGGTLNEAAPEPIENPLCGPASLTNPVALAAGYDFSLAIDAKGVVWAWGDDYIGQLGDGANTTLITPTLISGTSNFVSVAAGYNQTLALAADEHVWAWGDNSYGQLGLGDSAPSSTNSPAMVTVLTQIVAIAAGDSHSVALDESGNVWTWGAGYSGQLGNGGTANLATPTKLTTISNVIAIAAGNDHTIAVTSNKTIWTWGDNSEGELGRSDTNGGYDPLPAPVPGLSNQAIVAIAGGNDFTLAVTSNGQMYAWGDDSYGELGTNDCGGCVFCDGCYITNPVPVSGISNAVLVSAHPDGLHSLAVTVNQGTNQYYGWGYNYYGQVGNGSGETEQDTPAQLYFCNACSNCVQLGTGGVFTAQCTGVLRLYFNDSLGAFANNSGSYTATVVNVGTNIVVMGTNGQGAVAGVVTNGGVYQYTATGYCNWDDTDLGLQADPNGDDTNGMPWTCSGFVGIATCPNTECFSLVGRIQ
jgi:alpha-tubulin suppressor-like RCC1 family protein